jgi:hypothetical protein
MKIQAWAWLAAGVVALGLNGFYQDGGAAWAHRTVDGVVARIANRSEAVLALATGQADSFFAKAKLGTARREGASCKLATAMARVQARMVRAQSGMAQFDAISAREEATLARFEANRARIEARVARVRIAPVAFSMSNIPVISCPQVRVHIPRVNVPRVNVPLVNIPKISIPAPAVHVDVFDAGPV